MLAFANLGAQDNYLPLLNNQLTSQRLSKDSVYQDFLDEMGSLAPEVRDSACRLLTRDLSNLTPKTVFEITLASIQGSQAANPVALWQECIRQIEKQKPIDIQHLYKALNYCAGAYNSYGKISQAKAMYMRVIAHYPPAAIDEELAIAHNNLGAILNNHNDPRAALSNFLRARSIFIELLGKQHADIAVIDNAIGQVYFQLGEYEKQIRIQEEARDIYLGTLGRDHPMTGNVYLNLGIAYKESGLREASLEAFNTALEIRRSLNDHVGIVATLSEIAQHHASFRDSYSIEEVLEAQRTTIGLGTEYFGPDDPVLINAYYHLGLTLLGSNDLTHAFENLLHASGIKYAGILNNVDQTTNPLSYIPPVTRITSPTFHDVKIMENIGYASLKQYEQTRDTHYLDISLRYYITGDSIIEILKSQLLNGATRKRLIDEAGDFYVNASHAAMASYVRATSGNRQNRIQRLFTYIEKFRNWSMIDRYMESDRNARIRENVVLSRISDLRAQLPGVYAKEALPATDSLHRLVDVLIEQLKSSYPEYFRFLYNPGIASAEDIHAFCKSNQLQWLHYANLPDGRFVTILFTPDTIAVSTVLSSDSLELHRARITKSIEQQDWKFRTSAHALYKLIFGAYTTLLKPGTLYISSAGVLDNIPLDMLLTAPADHLPLEEVAQHYLVQKYAIALIPSGTFGMTIWEPEAIIKNSVFIAPGYVWPALDQSAMQAQAGSRILDGTYVAGTPDKEVVLAWLRETDLLHFAGHAFSHPTDLDSTFLLLGDGHDTLFLSTLFTTQSAARLAVLSSCFSATGRSTWEGNIGFAYGFSFAGTPQVISSLWSVSDQESSRLLEEFYQKFSRGTPSVPSLHAAKLQYLNSSPLPSRHPYFWANWVYYGHPVEYGNVQNLWRLLWIPAFMISLFMILRFRKRAS